MYYHHEISIMIFCALALYLLNKPVLPYLDISILGIGVFIGFGRIGCYSVGCCHGRPHKHGVKYGQAHVDAGFTWFYKDVPLLPVQLIESSYVFLIVISGVILLLNHAAPGTVLIVYTVVYGLMRFILARVLPSPRTHALIIRGNCLSPRDHRVAITACSYALAISAGVSATGNANANSDPRFTSLFAATTPPCFRMMCFTIASPKPVPPDSRDLALSTR